MHIYVRILVNCLHHQILPSSEWRTGNVLCFLTRQFLFCTESNSCTAQVIMHHPSWGKVRWCLADWTAHQGFFMRSASCPCAIVHDVHYGRGILLCQARRCYDTKHPWCFHTCWKNLVHECCTPSISPLVRWFCSRKLPTILLQIIWCRCLSFTKLWAGIEACLIWLWKVELVRNQYAPCISSLYVEAYLFFIPWKWKKKLIRISRFICSWAY